MTGNGSYDNASKKKGRPMIAELVRQYDTLKRCGAAVPDPGFAEVPVSLEIVLRGDGTFSGNVNWLEQSYGSKKKSTKTFPISDINCPVTEVSEVRSSGTGSPHGIVDNCTWVFGELSTRKKKEGKKDPGTALREAYLRQLDDFCDSRNDIPEVKQIRDILKDNTKRKQIWDAVLMCLRKNIKPERFSTAGKKNLRWVIEEIGTGGKPAHALAHVKEAWYEFQKAKAGWRLISCLDGAEKSARLLHPQPQGGSLVGFNDPVFHCSHLHPNFREKALAAQIGFDEATKYCAALDWLVANSSVRFGMVTNCIWIDQAGDKGAAIDSGAYNLMKPQAERTIFSRGKARGKKAIVLADISDLIKSLQQFRNGQQAGYRSKRFYFLSLLLRRNGRHAILGSFTSTMGELEDNTQRYIERTEISVPKGFPFKSDDLRPFCPTLMDVLDASATRSEKKRHLTWEREVMDVIVHGRALPMDLCRMVVLKALQHKHLDWAKDPQAEYCRLLVTAAACSRHALNAIAGKEVYRMDVDTRVATPGYLAGRFFAVCEGIQKQGRGGKATLSDKLFSASISRPRATLAQLYQNCRCYEISRAEDEWFKEILSKVTLSDQMDEGIACIPEDGVDAFEFILGYWHQRARIQGVR